MYSATQIRHLLGPERDALFRQIGFLIPVEQRHGLLKQGRFLKLGNQFLIRAEVVSVHGRLL